MRRNRSVVLLAGRRVNRAQPPTTAQTSRELLRSGADHCPDEQQAFALATDTVALWTRRGRVDDALIACALVKASGRLELSAMSRGVLARAYLEAAYAEVVEALGAVVRGVDSMCSAVSPRVLIPSASVRAIPEGQGGGANGAAGISAHNDDRRRA